MLLFELEGQAVKRFESSAPKFPGTLPTPSSWGGEREKAIGIIITMVMELQRQ